MTSRFELSDDFVSSVTGMFKTGSAWLLTLDDLVAEFESRWSIQCGEVFKSTSSFVTAASHGGQPFAVLRLMPTESGYFAAEYAATEAFGDSVAQLIESDVDHGAMLIERVIPGETLSALAVQDDRAAVSVLSNCMKSLHRPVTDFPFETVASMVEGFDAYKGKFGNSGPIKRTIVDRAQRIYAELADSQSEQVLLHGDLHHGNVLSSGSGWKAIDPQGVIGEREFETAASMRNPFELMINEPDLVALSKRRADQFADELGLDAERILQWSFARTVVSLCRQAVDDRVPLVPWTRFADQLEPFLASDRGREL